MQRRPKFTAFYEPNPSWGQLLKPNELFPQFFENDQPLYAKIKKDILNNDRNAKEVFRLMFKPAMKLTAGAKPLTGTTYFQKIRQEFGGQIVCTGVEEMKGGVTSLLLICVTGYIRSSNFSWGSLGDYGSMPNTDPSAHGPYYVIYSVNATAGKDKFPTNPSIKVIDYILVPFKENVTLIAEEVDKLLKCEMITSEEAARFKGKLIDYQGFYQQLVKFNENPIALEKFQESTKSPTPTKPKPKVSRLREGVVGRNLALDFGGYDSNHSTLFEDTSDSQKPAKRLAPTIADILAPPKPTL